MLSKLCSSLRNCYSLMLIRRLFLIPRLYSAHELLNEYEYCMNTVHIKVQYIYKTEGITRQFVIQRYST